VSASQTILIIDDHVNLARAFAMALEREGYVAYAANTAEDGLRLAQSEHPAAIVLDFRMPFINGVGFLYRLRAAAGQADTPVMVVTGAAVDEEVRAELADLRAVLRFKPMGVNDLLSEVRALLDADRSGEVRAVDCRPSAHS
jgi:DNA-binding response OmpR family regulator